jgi:hypothetical protein
VDAGPEIAWVAVDDRPMLPGATRGSLQREDERSGGVSVHQALTSSNRNPSCAVRSFASA